MPECATLSDNIIYSIRRGNTSQTAYDRQDGPYLNRRYSFALCEKAIEKALSVSGTEIIETPEENLIAEEVRLACLQGMLLCLTREIRLVFILGVVFEVTSHEGAHILDITPEAFRQRLSRGRKQVQNFMTKQCSLVHPENPCACARLIPYVTNSLARGPTSTKACIWLGCGLTRQ